MKIEKAEHSAKTQIISSNCDVMISFRLDGVIFHWNAVAENIFGYPAIEAIGRNISIVFPINYFKDPQAFISATAEKSTEYEIVCKTKEGDRINLLFHVFPVNSETETLQGISLIAKDITDTKRAEEKQAILSSIVSSSDDAIISKNLKGIITSWNKAATDIFGYSEEEAIGQNISIIIPFESKVEEELIIESIRKGEKIDHFETFRVAKDGTEKLVSLTVSPVKNRKGEIIGASKILRDLTEKDNDDERQATLAAIVTSSDDAIISKTLDGIITSWNHSATLMFGYTPEEAIGKHISFIIPKDRMHEETNIIQNIRQGNKIEHFETIRLAKNGSERQISLTISPIRNSRGKIIGASKIARDISLRIEAENKQKFYTQRLMDLNIYKDEFMVMASHELKTPLTVILASLQILEQMMEDDSRVEFISKTINQVNKLNELIYKLFDVSKIHAGKLKFELSHFDMKNLVEAIIDQTSKSTTHSLIFKCYGDNFAVYADEERIVQVVVNIIGNAIKYSPKQGEVLIELRKESKNITVNVYDKGIGIPQSDLENIFQRFYRVSGSASSFAGSGIGLYLSAEIVKYHKGKIWAESTIGEGSVFHFTIPTAD